MWPQVADPLEFEVEASRAKDRGAEARPPRVDSEAGDEAEEAEEAECRLLLHRRGSDSRLMRQGRAGLRLESMLSPSRRRRPPTRQLKVLYRFVDLMRMCCLIQDPRIPFYRRDSRVE